VFSTDTFDDVIPLPERNIIDPGEYEEGYSYPQIGLTNNWNHEQDNAQQVKEDNITVYWTGVFILAFIGLTVLVFYGIHKSRPVLAVGILGVLIVASIAGGIAISIQQLNSDSDSDGSTLTNLDQENNREPMGRCNDGR
jgi:hypothetical protein